ncbi:MAG: chitobiase/beta-hexosaminidase C-terminal domain-containing protein [Bacteroidetes bacterium]|nr:chitobiase/beta-hexosaminidase C-terminal domain-containing protein [Bacteroidota bacterium]
MERIRKIVNAILFGGIVLLLFLFLFEDKLQIPIWLQVAGRMHPLFLHFPIVLLILSIISCWLPDEIKNNSVWLYIRSAAAFSAIITAMMGMLLSIEQSDKGEILIWHKWSGVIVAIVSWLFFIYYDQLKQRKLYNRIISVAILFLVILTGHWGADLTHGENFLLQPLHLDQPASIDEENARIFADVINPIFKAKCGNCHIGHNQKGGLSLNDSLTISKGGKAGKAIEPGNLQKSIILERVHLPLIEKKHMPLTDKPQLSESEMKLLEIWIKAGAPYTKKIMELPINDSLRILAFEYLQPYLSLKKEPVYSFAAADEKKISELNNNYRIIKPLGFHSPALSVSFFGKAIYSFEKLKELETIKKQILHLNLSKMLVTDDQLDLIATFPNLERLNLNYTGITELGLNKLSNMKSLRSISLVGTNIGKAGLENLLKNKNIKEVFIWDTKIVGDDVVKIKKENTAVQIDQGFTGADTTLLALNIPFVKSPSGFFKETRSIEFGHVLKDVSIKYTTDRSEPDSSNGIVYKNLLVIDSTTNFQFKAFKKGWLPSKSTKASFIKAGMPIEKTILITPADSKYNAQSDKVLTDLDLGDIGDFSSKCLGYQKNDAVLIFDLGVAKTVQKVNVNTLQSIASYIFPPTRLEVLGSVDQIHWVTLKAINPIAPTKIIPAENYMFQLAFKSTTARYIKLIGSPVKKLPTWHPGKGQPGWFFMSEVIIY